MKALLHHHPALWAGCRSTTWPWLASVGRGKCTVCVGGKVRWACGDRVTCSRNSTSRYTVRLHLLVPLWPDAVMRFRKKHQKMERSRVLDDYVQQSPSSQWSLMLVRNKTFLMWSLWSLELCNKSAYPNIFYSDLLWIIGKYLHSS